MASAAGGSYSSISAGHTGNASTPPRKNEGGPLLLRQPDSVSVRWKHVWPGMQQGMTPSTPGPRQTPLRGAHTLVATHGLRLMLQDWPSSRACVIANTIACARATSMRLITLLSKSCAKSMPLPTADRKARYSLNEVNRNVCSCRHVRRTGGPGAWPRSVIFSLWWRSDLYQLYMVRK